MKAAPTPRPPSGLQKAGRGLWTSILKALDLDAHELQVLLEACRVADRLELLDVEIRRRGTVTEKGRPSGALIEARQQQIVLARLLAALRLPEDLNDPSTRSQRRAGARGIYRGEAA